MKAVREEDIRARAYAIWEERGRPIGFDQEHWAEAERELLDAAPDIAERSSTEAIAANEDAAAIDSVTELEPRAAEPTSARTSGERRAERATAATR